MSSTEQVDLLRGDDSTPWHALSTPEVEKKLATHERGRSREQVSELQNQHGKNEFSESEQTTIVERTIAQVRSPLTLVLLLAAVVTVTLGETLDAVVITLALLVAVVVGLIQEGKASKSFQKLARSQVHHATVIREGKKREILATELVPGDVVVLESGMQVPADIRITRAKKLSINEAPLTGEWLAVEKHPESVPVGTPLAEMSSMARMGTYISEGHGLGYVVATGDATSVGSLARELGSIVEVRTPLQEEMQRISHIMLYLILVLILCIFVIGILYGETVENMLFTSIAIAVASIPEGLPAAVTIVLAVGMEALLKRGGLVRNLLAAETLGSTTYVLTDKTGTLTKATMAVTDIRYCGCRKISHGKNVAADVCDWQHDARAKDIFDIALCASDAFMEEDEEHPEKYVVRGEPMERAILEAALEVGITNAGQSARANRIDYLSFSSENRFAAGISEEVGNRTLCINGAPEYVLQKSTHVLTADGVAPLTEDDRKYFEECIRIETLSGKRLIAVAKRSVPWSEVPQDGQSVLDETVFVGLLIFHDPVRSGVDEAIKGVIGAGATVRLVTGDNPETALSVARTVGIASEEDIALTGNDIKEQTDAELLRSLQTVKVFARVLPRQKMRLARILQASGEVVAMTGDGINDAPALQRADIGVAIGSGTEVAKEASDLVLVEDSFATIYAAIEEGRRIIGNLRKIVGYLLSTGLTEAVLIAGALVTGAAVPILPAQILWANMIEEGLMSVAFAFERGNQHAMKQKPQDIHAEGILSREVIFFIVSVVGVISILLVSLYAYVRMAGTPIEELRSIMFLAISIDSLFIAFSFRSLTTPIWNISMKHNPFFFGAFFLNFALLGVVISIPFMQNLLSYTPLSLEAMLLPLGYGIATLIAVECAKLIFFVRTGNS